jgi:hypothetical protein
MSIRAGVVVAVAFEQVDGAPYGKTCADGDDEGSQYVDCVFEEFHCADLLLLFWGKENTIRWDGVETLFDGYIFL